jgi:hypothetical protein
MPTYLTEDFTGTTGNNISSTNWVTGSNTAGATATIDSNRGQWGTGTSGTGRVSRRVNTGASTYSDLEFVGKIELSSGNNFPQICLRCDANVDTERGYQLNIDRFGTMRIIRTPSGYSGTVVATQSRTFTAGTVYSFRFRAIGGAIKARVWTGTEPGTWDLEYTDGSPLAAGYAGITVGNGEAANSYTWFDDIVVSSGQESITVTGSVTPTGVIVRGTFVKNPFVGSITAAGLWSYIKVVQRIFPSSITATGFLRKAPRKILASAVTSTGLFVKFPQKRFLSTVTPIGFFRKSFVRVYTGTITTVGNAVFTPLGRVFGRPGAAAVVIRAAGDAIARVRRG